MGFLALFFFFALPFFFLFVFSRESVLLLFCLCLCLFSLSFLASSAASFLFAHVFFLHSSCLHHHSHLVFSPYILNLSSACLTFPPFLLDTPSSVSSSRLCSSLLTPVSCFFMQKSSLPPLFSFPQSFSCCFIRSTFLFALHTFLFFPSRCVLNPSLYICAFLLNLFIFVFRQLCSLSLLSSFSYSFHPFPIPFFILLTHPLRFPNFPSPFSHFLP